jgi:hypothetical protein
MMPLIERIDDRTTGSTDQRALPDRKAGNHRTSHDTRRGADTRAAQDMTGTLSRRRRRSRNSHSQASHQKYLPHDIVPSRTSWPIATDGLEISRASWSKAEQLCYRRFISEGARGQQ